MFYLRCRETGTYYQFAGVRGMKETDLKYFLVPKEEASNFWELEQAVEIGYKLNHAPFRIHSFTVEED